MDDCSTDIVGSVEENSDDNVEDKEEPEKDKPISSIFEEKGEVKNHKPDYDPWRPLRQKVENYLYWNKVQ